MQKVTAAVLKKSGRILIARRKKGKHMGNKWEFPGGKIDPGETPEECLRRELAEEFSIDARIGPFLLSIRFQNEEVSLELLAYEAEHLSGDFQLHEHEEIRWVRPEEALRFDLADSDRVIAEALIRRQALPM